MKSFITPHNCINSVSAIIIAFTLITMPSCRNHVEMEDFYYNTAEQRLADTFYKAYGYPAPDENWNDATQMTLDIELPNGGGYRVMVFTDNPTEYGVDAYSLADYSAVNGGSNSLLFDAPKTQSEVYVIVESNDSKMGLMRADVENNRVSLVFDNFEDNLTFRAWQMQYYLAFEDLGIAIDLDYNDVVLGITWVSGSSTADIELLAIGTTLYTHAFFDDKGLFDEHELHELLGIRNTTLVNTFGPEPTFTLEDRRLSKFNHFNFPKLRETIYVPEGFSIAKDAGLFSIRTSAGVNPKDKEIKTSKLPDGPGKVPFAILKADAKWEWPSEAQPIILNTIQ